METSVSPPPPPPPAAAPTKPKLRIMCSYGGHIVPNPRTKSLCYVGGDTRILSIDPATASSLSSLATHLTATLSLPTPLFLKYQLPHHDLLSLISLSTDDDLLIFLDVLRRLSDSASRIRLFVFFATAHYSSKVIQHPKTESWFVDALESAKNVMRKGMIRSNGLVGFEGESPSECLSSGGEYSSGGGGGAVGAESIVLETSSSFGSTSSSASLSNLPYVKARDDDALAAGEYIARIQMHNTFQASGYHSMTPQMDQLQQQKVQYVQVGNQYIPQNSVGMMPVSSYYPMYHPQLHQQQPQHFHYQPNQPYPVYILPVAPPAQPYNLPMHGTIAHGHPPLHPNTSCIPPQATLQEPIKAGVSPDFASRVYMPVHSEMPHHVGVPRINVPYNENQQEPLGVSGVQHEPQSIAIASRESPDYDNQPDVDPARDQIYKSQPAAPSLASKYQSMSRDTPVHLSEALTQLHIDNRKQQTENVDPQ